MPWADRLRKPIPSLSSVSNEFTYSDYSKGMNSFVANDEFPAKKWRLAQNARIPRLGEYETRKALDYLSNAIGETQDQTQTSVTGAANQSISTTAWIAQPFIAGATARLSKVEINLKNDASATGTPLVEIWSNNSGSPGTMLARSSIAAGSLTSSYAYLTARFASAPQITSGTTYWIVCYTQAGGTGSYKWSSTTSATTAKTSTSGSSWSTTSYAMNFKQHYATDAAPKGMHYACKSDGTKNILIAAGTVLYSVNMGTGAVTSVKTGLNASATIYRFVTVNDIVYYVNGFDGLRKWNFTTESQVSSTNYSNICEHRGLLFLVSKDDPNKVVFSNFADFETFTSTDFLYVPSPKTGDPIAGLVPLNGTLVIPTLHNKWVLYGADNATFLLEQAPGRKGTYTQETIAFDKNFMYFVSDDGVYRFNGTEDKLVSRDVYQEVRDISNKDDSCLALNRGRLYLFHSQPSDSFNSRAWVFNTTLDCVESYDTDTFVKFATTGFNDDDKMIVASSVIGQLYWNELTTNDYTNLGDDIDFELRSHYMHFGSPARQKEIRRWVKSVGAQSGNYDLTFRYAYDMRENWQTLDGAGVQGSGYTWGSSGTVWGAFTWGNNAEWQFSHNIPGQFRRIAVGYKHFATREPQKFLSHTFVTQARRIR